jgi:uncharacterized membrane protein
MNSEELDTTEDNDEIMPSYEEPVHLETAVTIEKSRMHIGPIPSPEVLAEYNQIDPTFANRILVMAEQQSLHRQKMEKTIINSGTRDSLLGIVFGFLIGVITIIVSLILGLNGRTIESSLLGIGGLGGLVSVFIYGTRGKDNDEDKDENED